MRRVWLPMLVLGIAGFDPVGAITFVAAAALGVNRRRLGLFTLTAVGTSAILSVAAPLGLGGVIRQLTHRLPHHATRGEVSIAFLAAGVILLGWGLWRLVRHAGRSIPTDESDAANSTAHAPKSLSTTGMLVSGFLVGLSSLADPAWYAMVAFASGLRHPYEAVIVGVGWTILSHILLIVFALSLVFGWYEPVHRKLENLRRRWAPQLNALATWALIVAGLVGVVLGWVRLATPPHH